MCSIVTSVCVCGTDFTSAELRQKFKLVDVSGPKDSSGVPEDIQNLLKESISCHRTAAENISNEVVLSYGQGLDTVSKPTGQAKLKAAYTRIAAKEESMILAEQAHAKRGKEVAHESC